MDIQLYGMEKKNLLLHRVVWEKHNGPIPKGYVVHHIDHNRKNYDISNLCLLPMSEHNRQHIYENRPWIHITGKVKKHSSGFCSGAIPVIIFNENESLSFESVSSAAKFLGAKPGDVSAVCKGRKKTCKGWKCKYGK